MYRTLTIACVLAMTNASAQDLAQKIPADAFAVVSMQTARFFELMRVDDFNGTALGKAIVQKARESGLEDVDGIADFGIALDRTAYGYARLTDSISYFSMLIPIADITAFERHFGKDDDVTVAGGYKRLGKGPSGDDAVIAWSNDMLTITVANLVDSYFNQDTVAERYGIANYNYYDFYSEDAIDAADSAYLDDDAWTAADTAIADEVSVDSLDFGIPPPVLPDSLVWRSDADAYQEGAYEDGNPYQAHYAADQEIKRGLASAWIEGHVGMLFGPLAGHSVLTNRAYLSSRDAGALFSVWVPSFEAIYTTLLPELSAFRSSSGKLFNYYGSFQAGLFADKEGFTLRTAMDLDSDMAKRFKRIYGRKLNRKFLKYVNTDDAVGLFSVAMDTKAYLEELPELMRDTYGGLFAQYEDDINLAAELISLVVDEEAIAKVAQGDALFVLNGVSEMEVPYISYEYDEDYNYQEVEKTKTETIPDFLLMFSSADARLYDRVMAYVSNKGFVVEGNGVYRLANSELPFDLFFTRRDGIVFVGTGADQFEGISTNRFRAKVDQQTKKLLTKNKVAGLLSAKKLATQIPAEQLASLDRYIAFHKVFGSMGDFYFSSDGIKGNRVSGEFVAQTPAGFDNAVQYLFALVDYALGQR